MNNATAQITVDDIMRDAIDWTADCRGMSPGRKPRARDAVRYVNREYPGGWDAFERDMTQTVQL